MNTETKRRPVAAAGRLLAGLLAAATTAVGASAQFVQYTPPGGFFAAPESASEKLEEAMENARWRLGRLYFQPWLAVRDLSYVDSSQDTEESGLTATATAGVRAYLPVGSNWAVAAHVLPEYEYWHEDSTRNRWMGRYGAGLFGSRGRAGLEVTVSRVDETRLFSRELEEKVGVRDDEAAVTLHVDVGRGFAFHALASVLREEFRDPQLQAVDREERLARAGLRYETARGLGLFLGAESSRVEFEDPVNPRSNSGTAPVLELDYAGRRLSFSADFARRALTFADLAQKVDFSGLTGRAGLSWRILPPVEVELYGHRDLVYSFGADTPFFDDRSVGGGVRTSLGRRGSLRFFAETGSDDYFSVVPTADERRDVFDTFGGQIEMNLGPLTLVLTASETEYDSTLPRFDRTVTQVRSTVVVGPSSGSPWW